MRSPPRCSSPSSCSRRSAISASSRPRCAPAATPASRYFLTFAVQPALWLALVAFVATFFAWLAFLSRVPLGEGVMAGSITIVGVMLGGRLVFKERITLPRALAIALIAVGVGLVGWGRA